MRRAVRGLLAAVAAAGVVLLFVFPARTLLAEQHSLATTQARIAALDRENRFLATRAAALADPAQIEQIAHQQYGLVLPGHRSYAILPTPSPAAAPTAPATRSGHRSWWQTLEFWH